MYKFYMKNGQAQFYERGVEIDGTVYGIHTDRDILRIKRSVVNNKFAETDDNFDMDTEIAKIQHTSITFKQPTSEQLSQIQAKAFGRLAVQMNVQIIAQVDVQMNVHNTRRERKKRKYIY